MPVPPAGSFDVTQHSATSSRAASRPVRSATRVRVEPRRHAGPAAQNKVGGTLSDTESPATAHPHLTTLDPGILRRAPTGPVHSVHEPIVKLTSIVRNGRVRA